MKKVNEEIVKIMIKKTKQKNVFIMIVQNYETVD